MTDPSPASPSFADPLEERILGRIPYEVIALAAILAAAAGLAFGLLSGAFVLAGGLLSALSFVWLKGALTGILASGGRRAVRSGAILYAVRILLILGVFSLIILVSPKKIVAFAAGFSAIIPVFLGEAVFALAHWKSKPPWSS